MSAKTPGVERITRAEFYRLGGLRNSALFRRRSACGSWCYYHDTKHSRP